MGMKVWKELMVSTGEYQDRQSGETKKRWSKVGCIFQDDQDASKMSMSLEVMPMPKMDNNGYPKVSIAMFDPKPRQQQQQGGQYSAPQQAPQQDQFGSQGYAQQQGQPQQQPIQTPAPQQQQFGDDTPF
jgi:hypothetical protein